MNDEQKRRILKQQIFTEQSFGVTEFPRPVEVNSTAEEAVSEPETLEVFAKTTVNCQLCGLCEARTQVVFGEGHPDADLMFIGEGPGFEEDRQGRPFVGKAGQLLDKMIQAMGLSRKDVYIANCVKCRPPQNRNPLPDEIAACNPFLKKQIEFIKPKVICALGKFAAQTLLESDTPISRLRGSFHDYHGIKLMPTFHPAYLLRNPGDKKLVWLDLQAVMSELNLTVKQK